MINEETIQKKLKELTDQREKYIIEANTQIAALNGAIMLCEQLLAPPDPSEEKLT